MQYKESLAKTRELNRQSVQGVETKLEEIANRSHNQISELRAKLDFEIAKNTELEVKLRNEQDSNHCRQSRLHVALELAQNELKDCQEQLRAVQVTIPVRDTEIETLRKQLQERTKQLENAQISEQTFANMREQLERLKAENVQLKEQLEVRVHLKKLQHINRIIVSSFISYACVFVCESVNYKKIIILTPIIYFFFF